MDLHKHELVLSGEPMTLVLDIIVGIVTNILSTRLLETADRKKIEGILRDPAKKLTESAREFCNSEGISESTGDAVLDRAGKCVNEALVSLDELVSVQFDAQRVLKEIKKKQVYETYLRMIDGEEQHLFERFVEETVGLICLKLPKIEEIHRAASVRAAQEAHGHHTQSTQEHNDMLGMIRGLYERKESNEGYEDSLRGLLEQRVDEIRGLVLDEKLTDAETKVECILADLTTHFRALPEQDRAKALASAASYYSHKGNTERAKELIEEAETLASDIPRVRMVSAKVLALGKNYEGALTKLEGLDHENARILIIAIKHQMDSASDCSDDVEALEQSDTAEAHSALASYYMTNGDFCKAEDHARRALDSERNSHNLWMLGYSLMSRMLERKYGRDYQYRNVAVFMPTEQELAEIKEAREHLAEAVELAKSQLEPGDERTTEREIHLLQCLALFDEDAAVDLSRNMLQEDPTNFEAARYLLFTGRIKDAAAILEKVSTSDIKHELDVYAVAGIRMEIGQPKAALDMLLAWRDRQPAEDDYHFTLLLCRVYRLLGQPQQALDEIRSFGRRNGITIEQRKLVATHFAEMGNGQAAENAVEQILNIEDNADNLLFAWATLEGVSEPSKTTDFLKRLVDLSPKREFFVQLIKHLFRMEDYAGIIEAVGSARAADLRDRSFDKAEATALYYLGDFAAAEPMLQAAFESQKSEGWIEQGLGVNLAMCSFVAEHDLTAIRVLAELIEQPDAIPEAYAALIEHNDRIGRYEKAYDQAQAASARFPSDERARARDIMQAMSAGYMSEATEKMQTFTSDFPKSKAIWKVDADKGLDYIVASRDRQQQIWDMYQRGDIPRAFRADFSRFAMAFDWMLNTELNDSTEIYPKPPTYIASGSSGIHPGLVSDPKPRGIVLDYTALLTLESLGILGEVLKAFEVIYYAPHLPALLLAEIQMLSSAAVHIDRKTEIKDMVTAGDIVTRDWPPNWKTVNADLEKNYHADKLGQVTALGFQIADEIDGYYLDEYLLDNPHMDISGLPPELEARIVTIRDMIGLLWDGKKLPGVKREAALQYLEQFGCTSKERTTDRSGEISMDCPVVASLTSLETLYEMGVLHDLAAAYKGRILLSPFCVAELESRLREARICEKAKGRVESIQRAIIRCEHTQVVRLSLDEKVFRHEDIEDYSHTGIMCNAVNAALKTRTALVSDDRAIQRLTVDGLRRGTTLDILSLLHDAGMIADSKYEECYLQMLRWNCMFLPIDQFTITRILGRTPVQSKDAVLLANYYDGAFHDPGLSALPYSAGSLDSEAFRFYAECNSTLVRVLSNIWRSLDTNTERKVAASAFVRGSLWRKPEHLLHYFPGNELTESLQAVWHVRVILGLEQEDPKVASEFLQWYVPEWLNRDVTSPASMMSDLVNDSSEAMVDVLSHARDLRQKLSRTLPKELLALL